MTEELGDHIDKLMKQFDRDDRARYAIKMQRKRFEDETCEQIQRGNDSVECAHVPVPVFIGARGESTSTEASFEQCENCGQDVA